MAYVVKHNNRRLYVGFGPYGVCAEALMQHAQIFDSEAEARFILESEIRQSIRNEFKILEVVFGIWSIGIKGWARIADSTGDMEAHYAWSKPVMTFNTKAEAEFVVAPYNSKKKHFEVRPWILSLEY